MKDMAEARTKIGEIDKKMADLFVERMECAKVIAEYKGRNGLQIYDAKREAELLAKNTDYIEELELRPFYRHFMQNMMDVSKSYQHMILEGAKIAYSGIQGSFASLAAGRLFPDGQLVSCKNFQEAYNKVVEGECNIAVLPIENSYAGEVDQVMDLMFSGDLCINGVYALRVSQNLLGVPGSSVDSVKKVISHSQALSQCEEFIKAHGYETEQSVNTAVAAKYVAKLNDPTVAAIASKETAEIYGLTLLDHDINEDLNNTTKFAVFSASMDTMVNSADLSTFILMFTVKNEAGGLAKALNVMGKYGFNMRVLRSRPLKTIQWSYYFYAEVEGRFNSEEGDAMINELKSVCPTVKVLGSYKMDTEI